LFAVPRVPPADLVLKPDSSGRGLIATWKAPDPTKVNGRISFYIIKFRKVGSQGDNTTAIIDVCKYVSYFNLQPTIKHRSVTLLYGVVQCGAMTYSTAQYKCNVLSKNEKYHIHMRPCYLGRIPTYSMTWF